MEELEKYVILAGLGKDYHRMFQLWYSFFSGYGLDKMLIVITFDNESEALVRSLGIRVHPAGKQIIQLSDIFVERLSVIREYLEQGFHVIHTDLDAFWFSRSVVELANPAFDLQISKGGGHPRAAVEKWGFSLCCGFFILHSNSSTLDFTRTWVDETIKLRDDQTALNELLLRDPPGWHEGPHEGHIGTCRGYNLSLQAFSTQIISRGQNKDIRIERDKLRVFHPYLPAKDEESKRAEAIHRLAEEITG